MYNNKYIIKIWYNKKKYDWIPLNCLFLCVSKRQSERNLPRHILTSDYGMYVYIIE